MFDITVKWSTTSGGQKELSTVSRSLADAIRLMQLENRDIVFPYGAIKVPVGRS